jgi:general stress protein 26
MWITWRHANDKLTKEEVYWVSTTRKDGRPHAAPVSGIWLRNEFFFETDPSSVKARNLRRNPNVVVHVQDGYDTVIVDGSASVESRPKVLDKLRKEYEVKYDYSPNWSGPRAQTVYRVEPKIARAWKNPRMHRTMVNFVF